MKKIKHLKGNGFTLIELMVVIAIIAILAIVGITIFSGQQASARDSRRTQDITAIAKSLENHFIAQISDPTNGQDCPRDGGATALTLKSPGYCPLQPSWFAGQTIPTDPQGNKNAYCIFSTVGAGGAVKYDGSTETAGYGTTCPTTGITGNDATGKEALDTSANAADKPSIGGTTGISTAPVTAWAVCAYLETQKKFTCQYSSQQ